MHDVLCVSNCVACDVVVDRLFSSVIVDRLFSELVDRLFSR